MTRTVAIMQPTFLPWIGYFGMIDQADSFVYLDDVQLARRSWQTSNRLKGAAGPVQLAVSVAGKPSRPLIMDAKLSQNGFEDKLMRSAEHLLGGAPFGDAALEILGSAFRPLPKTLGDLNTTLIDAICTAARITTPRVRASTLAPPPAEKARRLRLIAEAVGADIYLSAPGSWPYIREDNPFAEGPVDLAFFSYDHPEYDQPFPPFLTHMAALEAFARVGPDGFLPLVRSGQKEPTHWTVMT